MGLHKFSLPLLMLAISYPLAADEDFHYECRMGGSLRVIAVYYDSVTKDVPCKVHYIKGGSDQLLWQARTQTGYCEAKAMEFIDQQGGKGWQCQHRSGAPSKPGSRLGSNVTRFRLAGISPNRCKIRADTASSRPCSSESEKPQL